MLAIKAVLDVDGIIQAEDAVVSGASFVAGQAYQNGNLVATEDAVTADDPYIAGFRYSPTGQLRILDATAGLPDPVNYHNGVAMSEDGQVCANIAAFDSDDAFYLNGIALTDDGRPYFGF